MSTIPDVLEAMAENLIKGNLANESASTEDIVAILSEHIEVLSKSASGSATSHIEEKEMPPVERDDELELEALPEDWQAYVSELEEDTLAIAKAADEKDDEIASLQARVAELESAASQGEEEPASEEQEILKSLPQEVLDMITADRERLEKAETALASERHERLRRDYIAKTRQFDGLADNIETLADALLAIDEQLPDHGETIFKVLETANERIAKGALFSEFGSDAESLGDAWDRATSLAKGLVDSGEFDNIEAARSEVWNKNPDLYGEYRSEQASANK